MMKIFLKLLGLMVGLPAAAIAFYFWGSSSSNRQQGYANTVSYTEGGLNYGAVFVPGETIHSIVSYNLGYLSGLTNNTATKLDRAGFDKNQQQVIAALEKLEPDIVALQEVDFGSQRSYEVDQSKAIAQGLGLDFGAIAISWDKNYVPFPYWPVSSHFGKMLSGQSVISRHPIQENSRIVLEKVADNPFYYNAFYLDRLAQVTKIQLGQPLIVINVHLEAFDEPTRVSQTQFVRSLAEDYAKTYPVILVGDFNSALNRGTFIDASGQDHGETQFSIKEMLASEQLVSAVPKSEWTGKNLTFPSDQPQYKLDYIFYTPSTIDMVDTQVVSAAGEASDHLPIRMRFRLKPSN